MIIFQCSYDFELLDMFMYIATMICACVFFQSYMYMLHGSRISKTKISLQVHVSLIKYRYYMCMYIKVPKCVKLPCLALYMYMYVYVHVHVHVGSIKSIPYQCFL